MTIGKNISNGNSMRPLTVLKINVSKSPCLVALNVRRLDSDGIQHVAWDSLDSKNSMVSYHLNGTSSTYCQLSCMIENTGINYINLYESNLISWFSIQDFSTDPVLSVYKGTTLDEVTTYNGKNKVLEDILEKGVNPTGSFSGYGNIFYNQPITNIDILGELNIKRLNHCSFRGCTKLQNLDGLSNSNIEYMGEMVFQNCSSLSNVNSLSNLHLVNANIPYGCFHGCSKITNLDVLSNCTFVAIGMGTTTVPTKTRSMNCFNGCSKLQNLDFLKSSTEITGIGNSIFSGCASLTSIDGLSSLRVDYIPSGCFAGCSKITSVNALSNCYTIKSLESAAFNNCKELTSLEPLKFDINTIPSDCFQNCWKLENLDVFKESHITSLNHACLQYCKKLQNLDFLENSDIKTITGQYGALQGCSELTSIDGLHNSHISVLTNPYAFSGLAMQNIDALSNMTVSAMAHSIFSSCSKLQNINGLSGCQLTSIPYALLQMCGSLNDVTPLKNMPIKSIEGNIINGSNALRKMEFDSELMSINKDAFYTSNTRTLSVYFNGNTAYQLSSMPGFPFRLNGTHDWLICRDGIYHGGWID